MATQDNNPGLLSKMARFVLNPTKPWAELNDSESIPASDFGKESLKQVIESKRHDDAIRKREFHQLRKLRNAAPNAKPRPSPEASAFRNSTGYGDIDSAGRSSTLKKIDEIEAQMSRQWWKNSSSASSTSTSTSAHSSISRSMAAEGPTTFPATLPSVFTTTTDATNLTQTTASPEFQPTVPGLGQLDAASDYHTSSHSAFSASTMVSMNMGPTLSDPEMEEAAIRYANGDDAGAEVALQEALQLPEAAPEKAIHWASALLDLYQCIGQQSNFERMALEYAQRFGRSPPTWPAPQTKIAASLGAAPRTSSTQSELQRWSCPAIIDDAAVVQLRNLVRSPGITYVLDWKAAKSIAGTPARSLAVLFAQWCKTALSLCFEGDAALNQLLASLAPNGDRATPNDLWQLRFDALRILGLQDEYELAALDFCVTFEVSPPPWREPICKRVDIASVTAQDDSGALLTDSMQAAGITAMPASPSCGLSLSNEVLGDVEGLVDQWKSMGTADDVLVVSCTKLIRVDFSAAGALLNWVTHLTTEGRQVEFHNVPRLVAAFFNLIGINEHAKVLTRAN